MKTFDVKLMASEGSLFLVHLFSALPRSFVICNLSLVPCRLSLVISH
jgi:hypothetical protein